MHIGNILKAQVKESGLKQCVIAERAGILPQNLSYFLGKDNLEWNTVIKILKAIGIKEFRVRL